MNVLILDLFTLNDLYKGTLQTSAHILLSATMLCLPSYRTALTEEVSNLDNLLAQNEPNVST